MARRASSNIRRVRLADADRAGVDHHFNRNTLARTHLADPHLSQGVLGKAVGVGHDAQPDAGSRQQWQGLYRSGQRFAPRTLGPEVLQQQPLPGCSLSGVGADTVQESIEIVG